ncbi:MAG: hypothetical protein GF317_17645, partial [Candidatus Lokiarchaeota archaeon]|nr:hypothetical protein [Candidatus Lokiarchaeota archaeon]
MNFWERRNNIRDNYAFFRFLRKLQANLFNVKNHINLRQEIKEALVKRLKDLLEVEVRANPNCLVVFCYLHRCIELGKLIDCPERHYDIMLRRHVSSEGWKEVSNFFDSFQYLFNLFVRKREFLILDRGERVKFNRGYEFL